MASRIESRVQVFGEAARHARFAVGVASLPAGVAVEVAAVLAVS
jgi:enamine deaminase RidA (YjgF/YER057c/UK114 family)